VMRRSANPGGSCQGPPAAQLCAIISPACSTRSRVEGREAPVL